MKKAFILLVTSIFLLSCSSNVDLAIDNPTDQSIIVKVDTLTVEIPAKEVVWVEMGEGEHSITLEDNSVTKYNFTESTYFVNPTKSEYLKSEEFYGNPVYQNNYAHAIPNKKVTFYGIEMEGNFDVVKELINPVTWDYGPRETLPEMLEMDAEDQYEIITKLYDFKELIDTMSSDQGLEEEEVGTSEIDSTGAVSVGVPETVQAEPQSN